MQTSELLLLMYRCLNTLLLNVITNKNDTVCHEHGLLVLLSPLAKGLNCGVEYALLVIQLFPLYGGGEGALFK